MNIRFTFVEFVMASFNSSTVDWVGMIEPRERFCASLDSRDGAKDDEVLAVEIDSCVVVLEETFAGRNDAAVAAPDFIQERWNDAVMHVAGEDEIEIIESRLNAFVGKVGRGVNKGDFCFVLRELFEFFRNGIKFIDEDINVFIGRGVFVIVVIIWRKRKAIDVEVTIFV